MSISIPLKKVRSGAIMPSFGSDQAAAWDLCACFADQSKVDAYSPDNDKIIYTPVSDIGKNVHPLGISIPPRFRALIPTGLSVALPEGTWMSVHSRSGLALKTGLVVGNGVGVVDSDYRGEIFVIMHNLSDRSIRVEHGDRIAQAMIRKVESHQYAFVEVQELTQTERGNGGFGSTGKKTVQ